MIKIEKHLFLFYISQIIVYLIISTILLELDFGGGLIGILFKIFLFSFFSIILLIPIFGILATKFCRNNYFIKRNIEFEDILLTSTAIVTTFLINDLLTFFNIFSKDFSFLLTIVLGIPIIFLIIYNITFWIAGSLN